MLLDNNFESTAPGNNPNNPDCLCDVDERMTYVNQQNQQNQCQCQQNNKPNIDKWVITIEHHVNDENNKNSAIETLIEAFTTIIKKLK